MKFLEASLEEVSREELKQAEVSLSGEWGSGKPLISTLPLADHIGLCYW